MGIALQRATVEVSLREESGAAKLVVAAPKR